ncbi:hypothetical protein HY490_04095 [Candidatus Woesearchaeota archaeon]|nr:hypothetical protein [Candidatus Woesearchaeota archaeon]
MAARLKRWMLYVLMYAVVGFYFVRTGVNFEGEVGYHQSVLDKSKEQYANRILFPFAVDAVSNVLHTFSLDYFGDVARLYRLLYVMVIAAVALAFQNYLRLWFDEKTSVIGTLLLLVSLPFSFIITGHVDSLFDLLLFTVGAHGIVTRKFWPLPLIVLIGAFNRTTIVFLAMLYFFAEFSNRSWSGVGIRAGVLVGIEVSVNMFVSHMRDVLDKPVYQDVFLWNIGCHHCLISVFLLFHVFWVLAFVGLREKPFVLQRWALVVPFYLVVHYLTGYVWETRMFLPLAVILIPLGLFSLFPNPEHNRS